MMAQVLHLPIAKTPATRADCVDGPRPCPYIKCRHSLIPENGGVGESCVLDVVDREGALVLEKIAERFGGVTRERVRQITEKAMRKVVREVRKGHALGQWADGREVLAEPDLAQATPKNASAGVAESGGRHSESDVEWTKPSTAVWLSPRWTEGETWTAEDRAWRSYIERARDMGLEHPPKKSRQRPVLRVVVAEQKETDMADKARAIASAARDEQIVEAVRAGAATPKAIHEATGFSPSSLFQHLPALVQAGKLVKTGNHRGARYTLPGQPLHLSKADAALAAAPKAPKAKRMPGRVAPLEKLGKYAPTPPKLRPADVTPSLGGYRVHWRGVVIECPDVRSLKELVEEVGS